MKRKTKCYKVPCNPPCNSGGCFSFKPWHKSVLLDECDSSFVLSPCDKKKIYKPILTCSFIKEAPKKLLCLKSKHFIKE